MKKELYKIISELLCDRFCPEDDILVGEDGGALILVKDEVVAQAIAEEVEFQRLPLRKVDNAMLQQSETKGFGGAYPYRSYEFDIVDCGDSAAVLVTGFPSQALDAILEYA